MNRVEKLAEIFGGLGKLAEACNVHHSLVTRWRKKGFVPPHYNGRILEAACARELNASAIASDGLLITNRCPCCDQLLPEGKVIDSRFLEKRYGGAA